MNLYIEIKDGQPVNHPAYESNLIQAFDFIPSNWEPFLRVERPSLQLYEILESEEPTYQKVNGVWTDVWAVRPMTSDEKAAQQQAVKDAWAARPYAQNWAAWIFNEDLCAYEPPIARPEPNEAKLQQRIFTYWCGADNNWKDTPVRPEGNYKFDFFAWKWVEVTG